MAPRYPVVPLELETEVEQLLADIAAALVVASCAGSPALAGLCLGEGGEIKPSPVVNAGLPPFAPARIGLAWLERRERKAMA